MVTVQRYNVILEIEEDALKKYLSLGYNQIDPHTGKVLRTAVPTDVGVLQVEFKKNKARIEELEAENAKLKKKIAALQKKQNKTSDE